MTDTLECAREQLGAEQPLEAELTCRLGLLSEPNKAVLWLTLGHALAKQKRHAESLTCYERACALRPDDPLLQRNLGIALLRINRPHDARVALEKALDASPDDLQTLKPLARALKALNDPMADAVYCQAQWAQAQTSNQKAAWAYQWGLALDTRGLISQAAYAYQQALSADSQHADAMLNLANLYHANGLLTHAGRRYAAMLERVPDDVRALNNQANVLRDAGLVAQALELQRQAIKHDPQRDVLHSNLLNTLQYLPGVEPSVLMAEAHQWGQMSATKAVQRLGYAPHRPRPTPRTRPPLRVGYVSSDFWMHAVGLFARNVILHHRPQAVVPYLYANGGRRDSLSAQLRDAVEKKGGRWHEVINMDDLQLAQQIRADGIDILIDLTGHTAASRIGMFTLRPCPVQISWMGYYATTGSPAIDFVIMDPWHAPPGTQTQFCETILHLPHNRFCYAPIDNSLEVSAPPSLTRGYVSFGSFNNTAKLNQSVLETWVRILRALPNSHLILKWRTFSDTEFTQSIRQFFSSRGIAAERLDLRNASPHPKMLAEYADIDIALDPFPFSGGHTSCEALWMGVPIITWPQARVVSRQTLSFLAAIGLADMAAQNQEDYVERAIELAQDPARLAHLRTNLRAALQNSPLCDPQGFTQSVERLFEQAWRTVAHTA